MTRSLKHLFLLFNFIFLIVISQVTYSGETIEMVKVAAANPCSMKHDWSNPCSKKRHKNNSCSMKHNPCSMHDNPCSMKHNSCGMKSNPCSMKHNSCSMHDNPCSMKHNSCGMKPNPCSMKHNSCSMHDNPCSMKHNPCGMKSNPCSMKHNSCGMKSNPCSMKHNPCGMGNPCSGKSSSIDIDSREVLRPKGTKLYTGNSRKELVKLGEKLFSDSALSPQGTTCASCHSTNHLFNASFAQAYPHNVVLAEDRAGITTPVNLDEFVQFCMKAPMESNTLPWEGKNLAALTAYSADVKQKEFIRWRESNSVAINVTGATSLITTAAN